MDLRLYSSKIFICITFFMYHTEHVCFNTSNIVYCLGLELVYCLLSMNLLMDLHLNTLKRLQKGYI